MDEKLIYAFDFDGTIVTNKFPEIGMPILNTIELSAKEKALSIMNYTYSLPIEECCRCCDQRVDWSD